MGSRAEIFPIVLRREMDVDGLAGGTRHVRCRAVDRERDGRGIPDSEIDGVLRFDLRPFSGIQHPVDHTLSVRRGAHPA